MNLINLFEHNLTNNEFYFYKTISEYKLEFISRNLSFSLPKEKLLNQLSLIHNKSSDPYFYIASYDPGVGKSTTLLSYIKAWKDGEFVPDEGALIILPSLEEISRYVKDSGLSNSEYAVLCSHNGMKELGLGYKRTDEARVLFTTHEMIRRRAGSSFSTSSDFFYRGSVRTLKVIDEGFLPAEFVSVPLDNIYGLYGKLRPTYPGLVTALQRAVPTYGAADGDVVRFPIGMGYPTKSELKARIPTITDEEISILRHLATLEALEVEIADDDDKGLCIVACPRPLPDDFAPAVILDGSARVRHAYEVLERSRSDFVRLPPCIHDYAHLEINLWKRSAGKKALGNVVDREQIIRCVTAIINADEDQWLIIHRKDDFARYGYMLRDEIEKQVSNPGRLQFTHWGKHKATNEFSQIQKVMVIGGYTYTHGTYRALYRSCTGGMGGQIDEKQLARLRQGEHMDHYLQGICRSNVRNADPKTGICGVAQVYVVAPVNQASRSTMEEIFPGAVVKQWLPVTKVLKGQAARLVEEILHRLPAGSHGAVAKGDVHRAVGSKGTMSNLLRIPGVRDRLKAEGIDIETYRFVRR